MSALRGARLGRRLTWWLGLVALTIAAAAPSARGAEPIARVFSAPVDRVWTVTESVLKSLGWEIDTSDRTVGWILTDSRGVEFKDFAVYGKGTRHKLRLTLKAAGNGQTSVAVERELYTEERILWMTDRKPIEATDHDVETAVLDAIQRGLP
jgi:hypothetical protein